MPADIIKPVNARFFFLLLLLAAFAAGSCAGVVHLTKKQAKLQQYRKFFNMPLDQQYESFHTFSMEKQFDVYIVAMTMREPPDAEFAADIANRREKVVPFLLGKLRQDGYPGLDGSVATDEIKEKIIFVFRTMHRLGYYDVRGDKGVIEAIRAEIANMTNSQSRRLSREYLSNILEEE